MISIEVTKSAGAKYFGMTKRYVAFTDMLSSYVNNNAAGGACSYPAEMLSTYDAFTLFGYKVSYGFNFTYDEEVSAFKGVVSFHALVHGKSILVFSMYFDETGNAYFSKDGPACPEIEMVDLVKLVVDNVAHSVMKTCSTTRVCKMLSGESVTVVCTSGLMSPPTMKMQELPSRA